MSFEGIKEVSLENVLFYLNSFEWRHAKSSYPGLMAFVSGENEDGDVLFIPANRSMPGYEKYLYEAILTLSEIQNLEPEIVLRAISFIDVDLHNLKIPGKDVPSIPIETAEKIIVAARTLLEEAAISESTTDKRKTADYFIKTCRFAHTWKGSFGFTIETPLGIEGLSLLGLQAETIPRKAGKRILNGLTIAKEAVQKKSKDFIIDNMDKGFNGKMCRSFVEISEKLHKKTIEYEFAWSPAIKIDKDLAKENRIVIDDVVFSYMRYVAEKIKDPDDSIETTVLGNVIGLRAPVEALLNEAGERSVTVKGISPSTGPITIQIPMNLDSYMHAYEAHGQTKGVQIKCRLRKKQRGWELLEILEWKFID